MRVLQINSVCGVGSTGRIATDIHQMVIEQGDESYIAYGRGLPKNCGTATRIGTRYDNFVHVALTRIQDKHGFGSRNVTENFINWVKELDPDIIHLHNIHGYYINVELLFDYLKEANKPVVWTLHDCWAFTGHCAYFDFVSCNKWESGCFDCPEKKSYPTSFYIDNSKDNFLKKKNIFTGVKNLTVVTPSKWLAETAKKSFLSEYTITVINNGIDLDIFKPVSNDFRTRYNLKDKFIILGIASIWDRRKGLEHFMEISKKISLDEVIVLVGLSKKQIKGLPNNILSISKTNNAKELAEIYSASDIFVNPTMEDNFPSTNLEAMACGLPVVTFNTGGSAECVDEECGISVSRGDINELLNAIKVIKEKTKASYTQKCQEKARRFYNKDIKFNEYINIYRNSIIKY
ncbi:D-inositol-3-phosphate glycosyltransferase [Paenibacillus allorhizoplanae]|uniref:D-inositol-3-phosphate glycosyltransferase n=1 Tax=Paenibacillus allorhizoplanae TaxID=2905648 RepID=A0ABM9CG83_9BACL|nr:glycosyltransferase family 4 protein [Paenibacillus allorhizoplanae]CAH1211455.1 D-inositol-3-phosphate glycosyltransferase [Paenibacillus allorhizoplanae]